MSSPVIETFLIDEVNEAKFVSHGLTSFQIIEVLESVHTIVHNRKHRRGLYLVIGRDLKGVCIAIPVEYTHDPAVWRPITAWPCQDSERTTLEKRE
jgi:hypothetical protein